MPKNAHYTKELRIQLPCNNYEVIAKDYNYKLRYFAA